LEEKEGEGEEEDEGERGSGGHGGGICAEMNVWRRAAGIKGQQAIHASIHVMSFSFRPCFQSFFPHRARTHATNDQQQPPTLARRSLVAWLVT